MSENTSIPERIYVHYSICIVHVNDDVGPEGGWGVKFDLFIALYRS